MKYIRIWCCIIPWRRKKEWKEGGSKKTRKEDSKGDIERRKKWEVKETLAIATMTFADKPRKRTSEIGNLCSVSRINIRQRFSSGSVEGMGDCLSVLRADESDKNHNNHNKWKMTDGKKKTKDEPRRRKKWKGKIETHMDGICYTAVRRKKRVTSGT
jgi:hypothetical protein